jgi:hypothetical protein
MIDVHALREAARQAREQATEAQADERSERAQSSDASAYDNVLRRRAEARMSREPGEDREAGA